MTNSIGLSVGDVIAQKYRVEQVLGAGGMGVVVAARHLQLDQEVAIKFLARDMLGDAMAVSRFEREARAAARLKGDHVVRVFDVGTLPEGAPYMVMERLHGIDLSAWLQRAGKLALEEAADFVVQTCVALAEAHQAGVIHRDIKPSNLFCVGESKQSVCIKVLDFGISKFTLASTPLDGSITATSTVIGSPSYMSPEQMRSANRVDARTDVWSLGVVLYELVTGKLPFRAETYPDLCLQITGEQPEPPRIHRADLPERFQNIVLRCLEKDPERRFGSVAQLAEALLEFAPASTHFKVSNAIRDASDATPAVPGESARKWRAPYFAWGRSARLPAWPRRSDVLRGSRRVPWFFRAAGGLLVAAGLFAAGFWWQAARPQAPSGAQTPSTTAPAASPTTPTGLPVAARDSAAPPPQVVPVAPATQPSASARLASAVSRPSAVALPAAGVPKPVAPGPSTTKPVKRAKTPVWTQRD